MAQTADEKRQIIAWWIHNRGPATVLEIARGCGLGSENVRRLLSIMPVRRVGYRGSGRQRQPYFAY